jgi:hypothetical protein
MGWLKGLVAPTAFGDSAQAPLPGLTPASGPPMGGMPPQGGSPYGGSPYGGSPYGVAPPAPAYDASALPSAMQWSTGTRPQGAQGASIAQGPGVSPLAETAVNAPASLEARCAQLQHDVDSLALFARALLTMLEDSKVVTRAQFDATKNRLDMLDGKLDDR